MFGSDMSRGSSDGDDGAAGFAQRLFRGARQQEGGRQIGIDDTVPFGERQPAQRLADHDAGIGDQRIEPAEAIE